MSKDDEASLLGIENESQLLELLKTRFLRDNVYNFIDDILISINPCKTLSSSHGKQQYLFQKVATSAINHLRLHNKNQCIVLTGDSGSGKTELSNKLTDFLTTTTKVTDCDLAQNIIQAGNVLESFGNACTLTSDNASRFIKFTELLFTEDVKLKGVYIHHYLLEKTRVVHHDKGEKNFHIFYQFLVGMAQENLEKYHLQPCVYHRYTGSDFDCTMEQDKYQDELTNLEECFKSLGFSHDNVETIFRVLAAILHIGDLTFSVKLGSKSVDVGDIETLRKASSLLRVSAEKLQFALVTEMTSVKGRLARRLRSISEASDARDMLSMALYTRVFAWIVWKINQYLAPMDVGTRYEQPFNENGLSLLSIIVTKLWRLYV
ncbi:hypothetical protein QZH41_017328 [Actinostola sp. cb2023]|nr:hypothetical protein QZH41_017328 [Actinostola sp. cb2023]